MYKDNSLISNKNGITLIVLVITIILLIILAGVVLVSLTGENGIITKAKEAAKKYENAQNLENEILEGYQNFENSDYDNTNNNIGSYSVGQEIDIDSLKDYGLHICDGSILNLSDYPNLGKSRSDLITHSIDKSPIFSSPNSRVTCSGTADGNWPAYLIFSPTLNTAGSGWLSQGGNNLKWVSIDMERNTNINKIEITNINHQNMTNSVGAPIDFSLKGSYDNITYNEILNITGNEHIGMGETYSYTFNEVSYRYYKIEITNGLPWVGGNQYYGFRSLKLFLEGDYIKLPDNPTQIIKIK